MISRLLLLNGILLLSACQNIPGFQIENRLACTLSKDKVYIVGSTGGILGGSASVNKDDAAVACAAMNAPVAK